MLKIQEDIKHQGITLPFYVLVSQLFQIETFQVIFESAEIVCSFLLFRGSIPYGGSNKDQQFYPIFILEKGCICLWQQYLNVKLHFGVTIKMSYGVDVLLHRPASHPIFSHWVG